MTNEKHPRDKVSGQLIFNVLIRLVNNKLIISGFKQDNIYKVLNAVLGI